MWKKRLDESGTAISSPLLAFAAYRGDKNTDIGAIASVCTERTPVRRPHRKDGRGTDESESKTCRKKKGTNATPAPPPVPDDPEVYPKFSEEEVASASQILDREYWSETDLYNYFSIAAPKTPPALVEVEDVLVRRRGGIKFMCVFRNNREERCSAWLCGALLYQYYKDTFFEANDFFRQKLPVAI